MNSLPSCRKEQLLFFECAQIAFLNPFFGNTKPQKFPSIYLFQIDMIFGSGIFPVKKGLIGKIEPVSDKFICHLIPPYLVVNSRYCRANAGYHIFCRRSILLTHLYDCFLNNPSGRTSPPGMNSSNNLLFCHKAVSAHNQQL